MLSEGESIISALLEELVSEDPHDLHPIPGVGESWEISPEQKTYTFHLRHNAEWSNGEPVVARNFVESYQRILSPKLASPVAYVLYPVANSERFNKGEIDNFDQVGFRALDDWTLEIVLTNPTPYFSFPAESLLMVSGPHSDGRKVRASF